MNKQLRREIILDNYQHPFHKDKEVDDSYIKVNTNNESCIDNLDIYFKVENGVILDVSFKGEACAISTSCSSILLRYLVGKNLNEVKVILDEYNKMINEEEYDQDILKDLIVYSDIYLQPNRKNCALLPVKAVLRLLDNLGEKNGN